MKENYELIDYVYQDASTGVYKVKKVLETLENRDNKITGLLKDILNQYEDFSSQSKRLLEENNIEVKEESYFSKIWSNMEINKEIKKDNSDASIADMMIKEISIGHLETCKRLKLEKEDKDREKEHEKLAKQYEKFQHKSIEKLKEYL